MDSRTQGQGFTLVELMVTVVILAVLSVVAVVSYAKWTRKARTTEAIQFLSEIGMKQAFYFATYGQFVDTSSGQSTFSDSDFYPDPITGGDKKWEIKCPGDQDAYPGWCALGARPTSEAVDYQYVTVGYATGDPDPPGRYVPDPTRQWWYAVARGDLDENGVYATFQLSSQQKEVYYWNETE
jgi:prepilin-type N-terminal cleavage/methylation domain-containing protein